MKTSALVAVTIILLFTSGLGIALVATGDLSFGQEDSLDPGPSPPPTVTPAAGAVPTLGPTPPPADQPSAPSTDDRPYQEGDPTPPPPMLPEQSVCRNDGRAPDADVDVIEVPPENVQINSIEYLPAFQRAIISLDWTEPPGTICRVFEVEANGDPVLSEGTPVLWPGLPRTPEFHVPARYCFRMYVGAPGGRSDFSEQVCIDLDVPSTESCAIDPSRGHFTTCELLP